MSLSVKILWHPESERESVLQSLQIIKIEGCFFNVIHECISAMQKIALKIKEFKYLGNSYWPFFCVNLIKTLLIWVPMKKKCYNLSV